MSIVLCHSFRKAFCALSFFLFCVSPLLAQTVRINTTKPANAINPRDSVGAGVDRIQVEAIDRDLTKEALQPVLDSGWQPVTYRQNTDLAVEAWHWNPEGTWSDPSGKGYFTGSTTSTGFIRHSFGYALPHRGVTRNDGTGNIGFSRITDGDESTYWKSNPYLASRYTGACARCGTARVFEFRLPPEILQPPATGVVYGGPEPSELLDPGEWLSVADDYARSVPVGSKLDGDALRSARQRLAVAIAALDEVRKFAPPGAVEVPPSAFTTPFGRAMWDKEPGRFRLIRLDAVRAAYAQAADRL